MKFKQSKGFTLIELLVVVAIIGILASIVLVSLNSARAKGRDASAKGSLSSMRATAEIYFDTWNSYGAVGSTDSQTLGSGALAGSPLASALSICDYEEIIRLANAVYNQTQSETACEVDGSAGSVSYTLSALMNDQRTYCVDSTGYAGYTTAANGLAALPGNSCI